VSGAATGVEWREKALRYEAAGFEYLQVADHVGFFDPFAAAVAAANVTSRLRVGSRVLNIGFWNPLLLARASVTAALLTDGRFVLGLGAGHAQVEFEQAGLDYSPAGERVRRLAGVLRALRHLSQGETVTDRGLGLRQAKLGLPATRLPFLVGGNGRGVLAVAGRDADMVSLVGSPPASDKPTPNCLTGPGTGWRIGSSWSELRHGNAAPRRKFTSWLNSRRLPRTRSAQCQAGPVRTTRYLSGTWTAHSFWWGTRCK